jgi:cell division protein FtsQ
MKIFLKILLIIVWVAIAAGVVVMMGFSNNTHQAKLCRGIVCNINYKGIEPLMSNKDLANGINKRFGKINEKPIGDVDVAGINAYLQKEPYLENLDVQVSVEGNIMVSADQCEPIIRFFTTTGEQHFIDKNGRIMPISPEYPFKTIIGTGEIESALGDGKNIFSVPASNKLLRHSLKSLYDLHEIATVIVADCTLNALIEQVNITKQGKIQLVTKAGSHIVYLGDTTDVAEKLENLKCFYKYGLVKTGWNKYGKINLEYKNQIVCTK